MRTKEWDPRAEAGELPLRWGYRGPEDGNDEWSDEEGQYMSLWSKIRQSVARDRGAREKSEQDVPTDSGNAGSRATGGVSQPEAQDSHSTTGASPNETFVGRASADEAGDAGMSGAEARAEEDGKQSGGSSQN